MHRLIVCFNALFLGIIIGLIFLAIFHAPADTHRHVANIFRAHTQSLRG